MSSKLEQPGKYFIYNKNKCLLCRGLDKRTQLKWDTWLNSIFWPIRWVSGVFLMAFLFFQKGSMDQQDRSMGRRGWQWAWELHTSPGLARGRIDMYACFYVRVQVMLWSTYTLWNDISNRANWLHHHLTYLLCMCVWRLKTSSEQLLNVQQTTVIHVTVRLFPGAGVGWPRCLSLQDDFPLLFQAIAEPLRSCPGEGPACKHGSLSSWLLCPFSFCQRSWWIRRLHPN